MAKGKYEEWRDPDRLILLQGWARNGLTDEQIAHNMGISRSTLNEWKKKYPDISDNIKKGKEVIDYEVENAVVSMALNGNITAAMFYLQNRCPDKWKDQRKLGVVLASKTEDDPITAALKKELENGTF